MKVKDKKKIKLAILIRNFSQSGGGAERYCVELTRALSDSYDIHVFCQKRNSNFKNVTFHNIKQYISKPRFINQILFSIVTKKALKKLNFDIVHSHDIVTHADVQTIHVPCFRTNLTSKTGIKKIWEYISIFLSPRKFSYFFMEKIAFGKNKQIIAVSNLLSKNIRLNYPHHTDIEIAYPGFNLIDGNIDNVEKINNSKKFVILFVGHSFIRKGLQQVIKAIELINHKNIELIVVGNGNKKDINFSSKLLKSNTTFLGQVNNLNEIYTNSNLLIHPTLGDTFGMVVLEAIYFGIPVIVSNKNFCGISEKLSEKEVLFLDNPLDYFEISKKIKLLRNNKSLREKLNKNAQKKISQFNWDSTSHNTIKTYSKLNITGTKK